MFNTVIAYWCIVFLTILSLPYIYFAGLLPSLFIVASDITQDGKEPALMARALNRIGIIGLIPIVCFGLNWAGSCIVFGKCYAAATSVAYAYAACLCVGVVGVIAALRFFPRAADRVRSKLTAKTELERNKKTDVREINNFLPKPLDFNPLKYIDQEKGIFLGLDEQQKPIYIPAGSGNNAPHIQVIGTTGAGKGVSFGVMASQFLARREAVFFCDPKNDEWAPHVLHEAAQCLGVPFHFINLNAPHGPQFNMFQGATKEEAFELFIGGFSLTEKGSSSDFYGIADRRVAATAAASLAQGGTAATPSINATSGGVDLAKIVEGGGICYIVGSMRNDIIKTIQRMLLIRLIQLAERRDRMAGPLRPVCIILDEVKYHISRPALEGLGAARDKGVHLVLAHQSLGDLEDCPADINPKAVVDAVVENCRVKVCYRVQSPTTARWLAEMSGTILVDDESRTVRKNLALAETIEGQRSIRQADRFLVDENMLLNLLPTTAVVFGLGLPKALTIKPLRVEKRREAVAVHVVAGAALVQGADALALDGPDAPAVPPQAEPDYYEPEEPTPGPLDLDLD